eukprot:363696-Chlamydomonas_euryale.AAC.14
MLDACNRRIVQVQVGRFGPACRQPFPAGPVHTSLLCVCAGMHPNTFKGNVHRNTREEIGGLKAWSRRLPLAPSTLPHLWVGLRHVMRVAGVGAVDVLGIDARAARSRVRQVLQHQHAGALAHDKAIAVLVPRA